MRLRERRWRRGALVWSRSKRGRAPRRRAARDEAWSASSCIVQSVSVSVSVSAASRNPKQEPRSSGGR
jgi:hypothetical protein